ncbi:MAG TPA: TadE/TadG family type IV pilus assembly protein [Candidatus Dormibacteraeota bacterium]|nr:TadE/TadG family type IV pilus assembly protein [Candidatus Dormibacteraeota bacterium]
MRRRRALGRRGEGAQSMLEFALIAPVLLVLVVGAAQLGAILYAGVSVASAAHDGAKVASEQPINSGAYSVSGGTVVVGSSTMCPPATGNPVCSAVAQSQGLLTSAVTTISKGTTPGTGSGCQPTWVPDGYVTVTVSDDVPIFVPFLNDVLANGAGGTIRTITSTVTIRVEPCSMTAGK